MGQSNDPPAADYERRLECAIADYLDAAATGRPRDPDALIAAYPDLAGDLRLFLADHQDIQRVANSSHSRLGIGTADQDAVTRAHSANSTPAACKSLSLSQLESTSPASDVARSLPLGR